MEYVDYRRYADYLRPVGSDAVGTPLNSPLSSESLGAASGLDCGSRLSFNGAGRWGARPNAAWHPSSCCCCCARDWRWSGGGGRNGREDARSLATVVAVLPAAVLVPPGDQLWFDPNLSAVRPPLSGDCASPKSLPSYCLGTPLCRPFQVEHIVGDARKQFFLSLMITSENFGSFFGPIWGALSDAAVGSDGRRRRRPIIVFGQCLFVAACVLMASAESFSVLLLSYMLFTFTATLSGAPYVVTNTTVPLEQRGMYNAMWSYQSLLMGFITSGLGAAVGENYLSQSGAYAISYVVALFPTLPIGAQTHTTPPSFVTTRALLHPLSS